MSIVQASTDNTKNNGGFYWNGKLVYQPQPKQMLFHNSDKRFLLLGGAAGSGKSYAISMHGVMLCNSFEDDKGNPIPIQGIILRRKFPDLEKSIIRPLLATLPSEKSGFYDYNASKHSMTFWNGSVLDFGHCRTEEDVYNYQGSEYHFIGLDESTHFTEFQIKYLWTRLRVPEPLRKFGVTERFFAATNPGNRSHNFHKAIWIDHDFRNHPEIKDLREEFLFIKSDLKDNAYLDYDTYASTLSLHGEKIKRQLLYGDWDINEGTFFNEFRKDVHVVPHFVIPDDWKKVVGIDYGFRAPSAVVWLAIEPVSGTVYCYRELYEAGLTFTKLAEKIVTMTPKDEKLDYLVCDPSIDHNTGESEMTGFTIMKNVLKKTRRWRLKKGDNERAIGWIMIRERLQIYKGANGKDDAHLKILNRSAIDKQGGCPKLAQNIPDQQYEDNETGKGDDVATNGDDHLCDALRYVIMSLSDKKSFSDSFDVVHKQSIFKKVFDRFSTVSY